VAESKISRYPFSSKHKKILASAHVTMLIEASRIIFGPPDRQTELAAQILSRLAVGAKHVDSANGAPEPMRFDDVAKFLASLAECDEAKLAKTVKTGLHSLGIERRQRGRPKGRKADTYYATYVELVADAIKHTGVFARKQEMKEQFGDDWRRHFEHFLRRENWPLDTLHLVSGSSSPQKLAEQIAADEFDRSSDRIHRAVKAAKSV